MTVTEKDLATKGQAAAAKFRAIRSKRFSRKTLAQAIRDLVTPEEQAMWLLKFSQGIDPDKEGNNTGFAPTNSERLKARIALIEFAHGQAPQRVQIEAELRATTGAMDGDFSVLSDEELANFRATARKVLHAGTKQVIEAEATERREDEEEADAAEAAELDQAESDTGLAR